MKKKTILQQMFVVGLLIVFPFLSQAGEVKTKDRPKECGGYRDSSYHLKCERDYNVKKDQGWKNPFSGFTKKSGKPKKQGSMPHSP